MLKCVLFNDTTSQLNWGCHATTFFTKNVIAKYGFEIIKILTLHDSRNHIELHKFINYIKNNNINYIFINGEGSLYEQHNIKGKSMIQFITHMKNLNKKTFLLNSCFDLKSKHNISLFKESLFNNLTIQLREPRSIQNFKNFYNKKIIFQPDFLLTINKEDYSCNILNEYKLTSKTYILIGGNSNYYRSDRPNYDAIKYYCELINKIKLITNKKIVIYAASAEEIKWLTTISNKVNCLLISVEKVNWQNAFILLSNAYLSISGRYHPSLMSLIGGVPSLCISANHCKMNGIHEMFELPWNVINSHKIHLNYDNVVKFIEQFKDENYYTVVSKNIVDKYEELKKLCIIDI